MGIIDWKRYVRLCEEASAPAIDRFAQTLRKAAGVATNQSMPVYEGALKGSLVTVLRQMTDILKHMARLQLQEKEYGRIRWKDVEDRMREVFFQRLCAIENMYVATEYVNTRLRNLPSDQEMMYQWVYGLQNKEDEIDRIAGRISAEAAAFASEDVPRIIDLAQTGIRFRSSRT
jgi:hypothetical protein